MKWYQDPTVDRLNRLLDIAIARRDIVAEINLRARVQARLAEVIAAR